MKINKKAQMSEAWSDTLKIILAILGIIVIVVLITKITGILG